MNSLSGRPLGDVGVGTPVGPLTVTISAAANERYWRSAGVDHPVLEDGALYPPIAANLTVLAFPTVLEQGLLQTAQRVVSHRRASAPVALTVSGSVTERYARRGREYAVVEAQVTLPDGSPLWTSVATFCEGGA
jgi:hypothetical protein